MTIDERLEFLLRSTESLHSTAQENTAQMAELTRTVTELSNKLSGMADTVSDIALAVLNHEKRLGSNGL